MKKVKDIFNSFLMAQILTEFRLKTVSEDYPDGITLADAELAFIDYIAHYGGLVASSLLEMIDDDTITESKLARLIVQKYYRQWYQLFKGAESQYEILYNVDGKEVRTIITEYGKKVTSEQLVDGFNNTTHGKTTTTEQLEDAYNNVTHSRTDTTEQIDEGYTNVTHGKSVENETLENAVSDSRAYGYNSTVAVNVAQTENDNGKVKSTESGTTDTAISAGKVENAESGTTNTTISAGKVENAESGTTNVSTNDGKHEDVESGRDVVTDTFERGGNIGTTMATDLLREHMLAWSNDMMNLLRYVYEDINKEVAIPMWG